MIDYTQGSGKQYHIGLGPEDTGRYVILTGDPGRVQEAAELLLDNPEFVCSNREYTSWNGTLEGEKVTVISHGIGGPSTAICVEELARNGAQVLIRMGTCGGMDLDVLGGDVIIASGSVRQEGTTAEYAPARYPAVPDFGVLEALVQAARKQNIRHHVGVVQSKDSFYGEHEPFSSAVGTQLHNQWQGYCAMGCKGSEMESAALFIVGALRHLRCGALFTALANQEREAAGLDNVQNHDLGGMMRTARDAMAALIRQDRENQHKF